MESFFLEGVTSPELMRQIRSFGVRSDFPRGMEIIFQGQWLDQLYLVESGYVKYMAFSETGKAQTISFIGQGAFFGEVPYFCGGKETAMAVETVTQTSCRIFGQAVMSRLCAMGEFRESILRNKLKKYRLLREQIAGVSFLSSEQRIMRVLYNVAEKFGTPDEEGVFFSFRMAEKDIADLSGCSLETVNRFMRKAKQHGLIIRRGRTIMARKEMLLSKGCC